MSEKLFICEAGGNCHKRPDWSCRHGVSHQHDAACDSCCKRDEAPERDKYKCVELNPDWDQ